MGYLVALIVALILLGVVFGVLMSIAKAIGEGAAETKNALVLWLGRKRLGATAFIPEGLDPLPEKDVDAAKLQQYYPKPEAVKAPERFVFRAAVEEFFTSALAEPVEAVDINEIDDLLFVENAPTYQDVFSTLGDAPSYPAAPRPAPPKIVRPPAWTPWVREIAEPSFAPPYYGPKFAFLNRFVDAAYSDESNKFKAADAAQGVRVELFCGPSNA